MKRLILIGLILIAMLALAGCSKTIIDSNGERHCLLGRFIEIETIRYHDMNSNPHRQCLAMDKDTGIVYIIEYGQYGSGISPYYIDNNGKAEIAIYDVNFK